MLKRGWEVLIFYAHSNKPNDPSDWEPLAKHLFRVAEQAEAFGAPLEIAAAAKVAGLLHDLGKYTPAFQARLSGSASRVDHSTAGAKLVFDLAAKADDSWVAALIAHAIAGHHAGLPDTRGSDDANLDRRLAGFDLAVLDSGHRDIVPERAEGLLPAFSWGTSPDALARQLAMLGRMIFSCLVDADFKTTERYYESIGERTKDRDWPALKDRLPVFLAGFDEEIAGFGPPETDIAAHRAEILATVRERAAMAPGLFTLNVPTGGGKTLASLGFALDHARASGD
ncbi:CRISPR-associated endonuclease Cas3'' [Aurantimonas sp. VKM B-3413]|uniref:CRISPR-associated endonuclease Cas3'' n=1 Tax=Aurantimonas sp. VKM B-3413 TaxID=2779401 RepID=UPI001E3CA7A3|nr:CRISPR-associated endonuclease Cas3'' [Aurantimonas sp. VKM B-3413]MCB8840030.1 CRISPR-associated endonuclease Cas3'' [Aurantimonas sp. VKM B-3413]